MRHKLLAAFALGCLAVAPSLAYADEAEVQYRHCISHKKAGKLDEAEKACRAAIAKRSDHASALYTLGTLERNQGKYEDALGHFKKVREVEPQNSLGWAGEGSVLLRLNRIDEAVEALRRAVALDPADTASIANLGNAFRKQGKTAEAIDTYKRALEKAPDDPDLLNNLAVALRAERKNAEAVELLTKALRTKPNDPNLSGNMAKALRAEKRYGDAIKYYETAIADHGASDPGLYFDLGYCYEQTGRKDQAIGAYRKHIELIKAKDPKGAANVQSVVDKLEGK
jgi:tetratricopeptide (TPR) repeat protein